MSHIAYPRKSFNQYTHLRKSFIMSEENSNYGPYSFKVEFLHERILVNNLDEFGLVVLEKKIFKFRKCIFVISL